jgi:Amt family ammonium transporter
MAAAAVSSAVTEQLDTLATLPVAYDGTLGGALDVNSAFTLASGYLVFFMHCGFAMLSIGCVRAKFAKHISMLILVDACTSGLAFYLFGWAIAFGDKTTPSNAPGANGLVSDPTAVSDNNAFIGTRYFALGNDFPNNQYYLFFFQYTFAATACTIVSGAIAERAKFESYILYSFFMAAWVYPVVVHSMWSSSSYIGAFRTNGKLLFGTGAIDYAGSGVVHMTGGIAAAVGCAILGPRLGRFRADGTAVEYAAHNYSLFLLGVMILWFGWYGFNPGSALAILPAGFSLPVQQAAVNTTLSPCCSGLVGLIMKAIMTKVQHGHRNYDLMTFGNSVLAGLVAVTAGCSVVYPWAAIIIGAVAGIVYNLGSWVSLKLHLDDPLDAIAVHAWNGTWGVIAVGFFASQRLIQSAYGARTDNGEDRLKYGCFMTGGDGNLLGAQLIEVIWIAGWTAVNMGLFFGLLRVAGLFRVDPKDEEEGLDHSYHGGSAYGDTAGESHFEYSKGDVAELRAEVEALKAGMGGGMGGGKGAIGNGKPVGTHTEAVVV